MHCTSSWLYHILPYLGMKGWVGHQTKTGWSWNCFAKSLLSFDCSSSFRIGGLISLWNDWLLWIEHDYWFMIYDVYGKAGGSPICSSYSAETTQGTWWYQYPSASTPTAAMVEVSNVMLPGEDIRIGRGFGPPERLNQPSPSSGLDSMSLCLGWLSTWKYMKWWNSLWYVLRPSRSSDGHVRLTCQIQWSKPMRSKRRVRYGLNSRTKGTEMNWSVSSMFTVWKHGTCIMHQFLHVESIMWGHVGMWKCPCPSTSRRCAEE